MKTRRGKKERSQADPKGRRRLMDKPQMKMRQASRPRQRLLDVEAARVFSRGGVNVIVAGVPWAGVAALLDLPPTCPANV